MSSIHILTHARRIENNDVRDKVYKVITPQTEQIFQDEWQALQTHTFKLECKRIDIEVVIPEIHDPANVAIDGYLIVPEFLILRRPYPIYVYLLFRNLNSRYYSAFSDVPTFSKKNRERQLNQANSVYL